MGLLLDTFRISDFFWKLGGGIIFEHGTILGSLRYHKTWTLIAWIVLNICLYIYFQYRQTLSFHKNVTYNLFAYRMMSWLQASIHDIHHSLGTGCFSNVGLKNKLALHAQLASFYKHGCILADFLLEWLLTIFAIFRYCTLLATFVISGHQQKCHQLQYNSGKYSSLCNT